MTFMEGLIGTDYITFTSGKMQRLTTMAMTQVSSSPEWVDYQLPPSVRDTAQHMMSTLNKIANAATAASNAQMHPPYSTEEFLAGMAGRSSLHLLTGYCALAPEPQLHCKHGLDASYVAKGLG